MRFNTKRVVYSVGIAVIMWSILSYIIPAPNQNKSKISSKSSERVQIVPEAKSTGITSGLSKSKFHAMNLREQMENPVKMTDVKDKQPFMFDTSSIAKISVKAQKVVSPKVPSLTEKESINEKIITTEKPQDLIKPSITQQEILTKTNLSKKPKNGTNVTVQYHSNKISNQNVTLQKKIKETEEIRETPVYQNTITQERHRTTMVRNSLNKDQSNDLGSGSMDQIKVTTKNGNEERKDNARSAAGRNAMVNDGGRVNLNRTANNRYTTATKGDYGNEKKDHGNQRTSAKLTSKTNNITVNHVKIVEDKRPAKNHTIATKNIQGSAKKDERTSTGDEAQSTGNNASEQMSKIQ